MNPAGQPVPAPAAAPNAAPGQVPATPSAILVVDDDHAIRQVLSGAIEFEGYSVLTAAHGAEALEVVRASAGLGQTIGAIVLDLQMPILTGTDFVRAYHALPGPHAPILLFSAQLDMRAQVANLRIDALLGKPAELDTVLDLLATLSASPPAPLRRGGRYHPRWTGGDPLEWWVWDTWEGCPADLPPSLSRTTALDIAHTLDQRQTARDQRRWLQHEIVAPK